MVVLVLLNASSLVLDGRSSFSFGRFTWTLKRLIDRSFLSSACSVAPPSFAVTERFQISRKYAQRVKTNVALLEMPPFRFHRKVKGARVRLEPRCFARVVPVMLCYV